VHVRCNTLLRLGEYVGRQSGHRIRSELHDPKLKIPSVRVPVATGVLLLALAVPGLASGYSWPVKPFDKPHAIRGDFGDPRFHVDAESELSAFHFGVDIVAPDGTPVYAVEPGVVVRLHSDSVTIGRSSGRRFGYWHIRPVVKSGTHVRLHQLIGHVIKGWGHVHLAESIAGTYRNPLRKGALTPFYDHTVPTIASVRIQTPSGALADDGRLAGPIDIVANIFDTPPVTPPPPWNVARLAPASVWWDLMSSSGALVAADLTASFGTGLPFNNLYNWYYAPGTYQNKPNRPGQYLFWITHDLDTALFPNGTYTLQVMASDTRSNVAIASLQLVFANG